MNPAKKHLTRSIACYSEMLEQYDRIRDAIAGGAPAAVLYQRLEQLKDLGQQARQSDAEVEKHSGGFASLPDDSHDLLQWRDLLSRVFEENRRMKHYVSSAMAAAKDEIDRIGEGKKALGGYRGAGASTGRRINVRSG